VFRGSHSAKIDDKGRLKIPNAFRTLVADQRAGGLFVTSLSGESVLVYPMAAWLALEERLARVASITPARGRFLDRVNYYGQVGEFDAQGRVVIPPRLRESAGMTGEVDVLGQFDHLEIWNHERFIAKLQREPFTDDDARTLAGFGI
jgi:MraZ protein